MTLRSPAIAPDAPYPMRGGALRWTAPKPHGGRLPLDAVAGVARSFFVAAEVDPGRAVARTPDLHADLRVHDGRARLRRTLRRAPHSLGA
ncbi:hypothetical protein [Rubrimonas cliftonensis]|uniref:Uncharacterized protein n=1 Tax=Rubrimonas cliftonensis TaxID=89524 RepID=A0A1H4E3X7_9RHOB|nr:hypothetical protein [Rubrimonas cliftonensis]SEA79745.1 hypothetical protein SAMN05444370_11236 [Rubrimonas cliftonensis]